jgi:hypothetical protein
VSQSSASVNGGIALNSSALISIVSGFTAEGKILGEKWNPDPDESNVWQEQTPVINPWVVVEQSSKTWSNR